MTILFTGRGNAGSWIIRGEQLAAAMNATCAANATYADVLDAELVVVVKKATPTMLSYLRQAHKRWVFDAVDFYPQPLCTHWSHSEAIAWVRNQVKQMDPTAVVWPNQRMQQDCNDGRPSFVLYHHYRPGLQPITVTPKLRVVTYEGASAYLGQWKSALDRVCKEHNCGFIANPPSMCVSDAVIAVRDKPFAGYAQMHWKSNVKLANAQALGAVFIGQRECGYMETATGAEIWVRTQDDLHEALSTIVPQHFRSSMQSKALTGAYSVQQAAKDLEGFLRGL